MSDGIDEIRALGQVARRVLPNMEEFRFKSGDVSISISMIPTAFRADSWMSEVLIDGDTINYADWVYETSYAKTAEAAFEAALRSLVPLCDTLNDMLREVKSP